MERSNPGLFAVTGRSVGAFASASTAVLWLLAIWSPDTSGFLAGSWSLVVAHLLVVVSVVGVIASVRGHGNVMLIAFLLSFLPVGAVLLRVDHWLRWIGVLNLLLLFASLATRFSTRRGEQGT